MDASDERRARNELLFREVNERVEEINERLDGETHDSLMVFVCECGNTACNEHLTFAPLFVTATNKNNLG